MQKKAYTPPTITEHGNIVEKTKGFGGTIWESLSPKNYPDIPDEEEQG